MDFGKEYELDLEEDMPENESEKCDEPEKVVKEKIQDLDANGCDQYLQIDCLEDEEDLLSKVTLDKAQPENTVNDKVAKPKDSANEEKKKSKKKKENKQGENQQSNNSGKVNRKKRKVKNFGLPLYRSVCPKKWRPDGNNFKKLRGQSVGQGLDHLKGLPLQYPKLHHFSQNYFQNQNDLVSLLGLNTTKNQNMQQINNVLIQCSDPMLDVRKNLIRNVLLGQCGNPILSQFQCNDYYMFKEHPDISLPEEQTELKSKKEARLLRFMDDESNKKEKKSAGSVSEKSVVGNLNLEDEYFRKMEEQKRKRQEIFYLKEQLNHCNEKCTSDWLGINKELLLRKENPFENTCKILEKGVKFEMKQEREENATLNQNGNSFLKKLSYSKKEAECPVKFVRTISKSFEELGLSKTKSGLFSRIPRIEDVSLGSDSLFENFPKAELADTASQTQEVKLNFPKENSVAIRFAEPKSAENFFKLYNGRVFDSHTLNVIIV